jgi:DNA-binding GntR family transcriptional regulator
MEVTALKGLFDGTGNALLKHGALNIETCLLDSDEARLLQTSPPEAAWCVEHVFYDFHDRTVSWGWFICRNTSLHFTANVGISNA